MAAYMRCGINAVADQSPLRDSYLETVSVIVKRCWSVTDSASSAIRT